MNTTKPLAGKIALVTGSASQGIGRAIAHALADAGADIAVHGRDDQSEAETLSQELIAADVDAAPFLADFARPEASRQLVSDVIGHFGRIDILVNNAGLSLRRPIMDCSDEDFDELLAVNLRSYFAAAQAAARDMIAREAEGRLIFVSSINQDVVVAGQGLYCATKGGVRQLARAMALELAPHGITSNIIAPGLVYSDFNREVLADEKFRAFATGGIPMSRGATPEEIAGAAVYFALPSSRYVTGASLAIDGGKSLP